MVFVENSEFLEEIFGEVMGLLWTCSFIESPNDSPNWSGNAYHLGDLLILPETHNNYFSVAELSQPRRIKNNFVRMAVLVLDDADLSALPIEPSYVIETSPGKHQIGFILIDTPETRNQEYCANALKSLIEHGMVPADKSGNSIVRYVRLPVGSNTKPRETGSFQHALHVWEPSRRYNISDVLIALGASIPAASFTPDAALHNKIDGKLNIQEAIEEILTGEALHDNLIRLAGHFVALGMSQTDTESTLKAYMENSSIKTYDPKRWKARYKEIPKAVQSAIEKFSNEFSNTVAPISTYPEPMNLFANALGTLPVWNAEDYPTVIANLAKDVARRIGVDPAIPAWTAISAIAALIHDCHSLQVKAFDTNWSESARLWIAFVGTPSSKKSPAMNEVLMPLKKLQTTWHEEYKLNMVEWKNRCAVAKKEKSPEPEQPHPKKVFVNDTTLEALYNILEYNDGGILAIHDELSGLFGSMDAYRHKGISKDRPAWLTAYNGGNYFVDRAGKGSQCIKNFSVGIIGGIQPDIMRKIARHLGDDDGLVQRFIFLPVKSAGAGTDVAPCPVAQAAWNNLCNELPQMIFVPDRIRLSPETQSIMDDARRKLHALSLNPAYDGRLQTALQKAEGQLARLTLIFHFIENREVSGIIVNQPATVVNADTVRKAVHLFLRFVVPNTIAFYQDIVGEGEAMSLARLAAGFILAHKQEQVKERELYRAHREFREDAGRRALATAMQQLELAGWVSQVSSRHGKPTSVWQINPRVYSDFGELADAERQRRELVKTQIAEAAKLSRLSLECSIDNETI